MLEQFWLGLFWFIKYGGATVDSGRVYYDKVDMFICFTKTDNYARLFCGLHP